MLWRTNVQAGDSRGSARRTPGRAMRCTLGGGGAGDVALLGSSCLWLGAASKSRRSSGFCDAPHRRGATAAELKPLWKPRSARFREAHAGHHRERCLTPAMPPGAAHTAIVPPAGRDRGCRRRQVSAHARGSANRLHRRWDQLLLLRVKAARRLTTVKCGAEFEAMQTRRYGDVRCRCQFCRRFRSEAPLKSPSKRVIAAPRNLLDCNACLHRRTWYWRETRKGRARRRPSSRRPHQCRNRPAVLTCSASR